MKIFVNKISAEGLVLEENISASSLDLETDIVKFPGSISIRAEVSKITNAVTVRLFLVGSMAVQCSRCLSDFQIDCKKELKLHYQVSNPQQVIELNEEIRQEIILDCPVKPLCKSDCQGLCTKCGRNLNQDACNCAVY